MRSFQGMWAVIVPSICCSLTCARPVDTLSAAEPPGYHAQPECDLFVVDVGGQEPARFLKTFRNSVLPIAADDGAVYFRLGFQHPNDPSVDGIRQNLIVDEDFGTVHAVSRITGQPIWSLKSDEASYGRQVLDPSGPAARGFPGTANLPHAETLVAPQVIVDGALIVLTKESNEINNVSSVDVKTGQARWRQPLEELRHPDARRWYGPATDAKLTVVSNKYASFGIERSSGKVLWTAPAAKRFLFDDTHVVGIVQERGFKFWRLDRKTTQVVESKDGSKDNQDFVPLGFHQQRLIGWDSTFTPPMECRFILQEADFTTSLPSVNIIAKKDVPYGYGGVIPDCPWVEQSGLRYVVDNKGIQCLDLVGGKFGFHIPLPKQCFPIAVNEKELFVAINKISSTEPLEKRISSFNPRTGEFLRHVWEHQRPALENLKDQESRNRLNLAFERATICNGILGNRYLYVFVRK